VLPVVEEPRPGFFRFADKNRPRQVAEVAFMHAHPRASDDGERVTALQLAEDLAHPCPLHAHPGDADDVGACDPIEIERLDVLIENPHAVLRRRERGEQRQARHRHRRTLAEQRQRVLQAPVRGLEPRIDEDDVGRGAIRHP
jgi:hypothetical protein